MKAPRKSETAHRVIALLNREQVDYLDKLGKDALFTTGLKLSRTKIISAMINALREAGVSGAGFRSAEELERKIVQMIRGGQSSTGSSDAALGKTA